MVRRANASGVRSLFSYSGGSGKISQKKRQGVILFGSIALAGVKSDGEQQA